MKVDKITRGGVQGWVALQGRPDGIYGGGIHYTMDQGGGFLYRGSRHDSLEK